MAKAIYRLYFTLSKAKRLITTNYAQLSNTQLQKAFVILRDFNRFINDHSTDEHAFDTLMNGGYFKSVADPNASGLVPADIWLGANLRYALERAIQERKARTGRK